MQTYARTGYLGFLRRTEAIGSDGGQAIKYSFNLQTSDQDLDSFWSHEKKRSIEMRKIEKFSCCDDLENGVNPNLWSNSERKSFFFFKEL